jgi:hypothetical protein
MAKDRLAIRIDADRKEDWRTIAERNDTEYSSITHLIELSVMRELEDNESNAGGSDAVAYDPEVTNAELYEELRNLKREVKGTAENVAAIKDEVTTSGVPELRQFFDALPKSEDYAVTPEQLADSMEHTDPEHTREILEELEKETGRVKTTTIMDEIHYYKEV